jgi:hypothetical protein
MLSRGAPQHGGERAARPVSGDARHQTMPRQRRHGGVGRRRHRTPGWRPALGLRICVAFAIFGLSEALSLARASWVPSAARVRPRRSRPALAAGRRGWAAPRGPRAHNSAAVLTSSRADAATIGVMYAVLPRRATLPSLAA